MNADEKLRKKIAEDIAQGATGAVSLDSTQAQLLQELQVHQVELEMQNDELRRTQQELMRTSARYTALFQNAPVGYVVLDKNCIITEYNETFLNLIGLPDEKVNRRGLSNFLAAPDDAVFLSHFKAWLSVPYGKSMVARIHPKGDASQSRWIQITCATPLIGTSEGASLLVTIADITQIKTTEEALKTKVNELSEITERLESTRTQLLQSEKMAAIGQLSAGVAHEINNPVGFVQSNFATLSEYAKDLLEILTFVESRIKNNDRDPLHGDFQHLAEQIDLNFIKEDLPNLLTESRKGLDRIKRIVSDLKDFSHIGELNWEWADLHACIDSTLNIVWNEIKYRAQVVKAYGDIPRVYCVPSQISQVIMNLLVNAAQAITKSGTIRISTGVVPDPLGRPENVWFEIEDDGEGIAPEHLSRLFEPFFTTKPVGKGTGLGLSISWSIIEHHRGTFDVTSTPGKGTSFRISLPADPISSTASKEPSND